MTTASHSFLNDTNQLQLNRSARYVQQQHVNQFRSIENVPSTQDDFLQFDELIYGNSGIVNERFGLNTVDESIDKKSSFTAPPKIKREVKTNSNNKISDGELNKPFASVEPKSVYREAHDDPVDESVAEEIENFFVYAWSDMYWLATIVVFMTLFGCFFAHHADLRQRMVGARMRVACCSLVYRKVKF